MYHKHSISLFLTLTLATFALSLPGKTTKSISQTIFSQNLIQIQKPNQYSEISPLEHTSQGSARFSTFEKLQDSPQDYVAPNPLYAHIMMAFLACLYLFGYIIYQCRIYPKEKEYRDKLDAAMADMESPV